MNKKQDEAFIARLRSIRQKYGCQSYNAYNSNKIGLSHPHTQTVNPQTQIRRVFDEKFMKPNPQFRDVDNIGCILKYDNRFQRAYSHGKDKYETEEPYKKRCEFPNKQMNEAHIKRQENFNSFIRDLDTRMEQKQRLISQRIRQNEKLSRKIQQYSEPTHNNGFQRYNSSKELHRQPVDQPFLIDSIPRKSYDRSIAYKCKLQAENNPHESASKLDWIQRTGGRKDKEYSCVNRESQRMFNPSSSKLIIQRKLQGNKELGRDNWTSNKLDTLQQRIKSVLQQTNQ